MKFFSCCGQRGHLAVRGTTRHVHHSLSCVQRKFAKNLSEMKPVCNQQFDRHLFDEFGSKLTRAHSSRHNVAECSYPYTNFEFSSKIILKVAFTIFFFRSVLRNFFSPPNPKGLPTFAETLALGKNPFPPRTSMSLPLKRTIKLFVLIVHPARLAKASKGRP